MIRTGQSSSLTSTIVRLRFFSWSWSACSLRKRVTSPSPQSNALRSCALVIGSISKAVSHPFTPAAPVALGRRARTLRRLPILVKCGQEELVVLAREQQALVPAQDLIRLLAEC